ncbi:hypothetical protein [Microcoleus sp. F4-D5]|uniref:hypothetical protein n=1 Tax=Microcoleus sp. F4-D5 TaxID=2818760 RepID=UPI002FD1D15B
MLKKRDRPYVAICHKAGFKGDRYKHEQDGDGGNRNAISLPQNNHSPQFKNLTIPRLIVGKRHGRFLISGYAYKLQLISPDN